MKLEEVMQNVYLITGYENKKKIEYYFNKLIIKVLDYTNREELNAPLETFIEDKLIQIAKQEIENDKAGTLNGVDLKNVKSITRGDTSITLTDNKNNGSVQDVSTYLEFTAKDCIILNRHRRVWRNG